VTVYQIYDGQYTVYPVGNPNTTQITVDAPGRVKLILLPTQSQPLQLTLNGNSGYLNQGNVLSAGSWYEFEFVSCGKDIISINGQIEGIYLRVIVYD